jgi:hypothetical protein
MKGPRLAQATQFGKGHLTDDGKGLNQKRGRGPARIAPATQIWPELRANTSKAGYNRSRHLALPCGSPWKAPAHRSFAVPSEIRAEVEC